MTTDPNAAALARIRQMADHWEQHLPEVIRTAAVVSALRAALESAEPSAAGLGVSATPSHTDQAALREAIAAAIWARTPEAEPSRHGLVMGNPHGIADAVLAVLPPPVDRAAVLRDLVHKAEEWDGHITVQELRRLADEAQQQPETETLTAIDRNALSEKLWRIAEHHIIAEWICCEPLEPRHHLCAKGYAALGMTKTLLVDSAPEEAWNPAAPVLDAVIAELEQLRRERDLAIAHDRQPYPTAWAYEQACKALRRKTDVLDRVREYLERHEHRVAVSPLDVLALLDEAQQQEPESGCAHCGGDHSWDDCQAYTAVVAAAPQPEPPVHGESVAHLAGLHDGRDQWADDEQPVVPVHAVPLPGSNGISACCGRPPCEFVGERVTRDPEEVTCTGPAVDARQDGAQR